jgi:hypothetical protein
MLSTSLAKAWNIARPEYFFHTLNPYANEIPLLSHLIYLE